MLWMLGVVAILADVISRFTDPSRNAVTSNSTLLVNMTTTSTTIPTPSTSTTARLTTMSTTIPTLSTSTTARLTTPSTPTSVVVSTAHPIEIAIDGQEGRKLKKWGIVRKGPANNKMDSEEGEGDEGETGAGGEELEEVGEGGGTTTGEKVGGHGGGGGDGVVAGEITEGGSGGGDGDWADGAIDVEQTLTMGGADETGKGLEVVGGGDEGSEVGEGDGEDEMIVDVVVEVPNASVPSDASKNYGYLRQPQNQTSHQGEPASQEKQNESQIWGDSSSEVDISAPKDPVSQKTSDQEDSSPQEKQAKTLASSVQKGSGSQGNQSESGAGVGRKQQNHTSSPASNPPEANHNSKGMSKSINNYHDPLPVSHLEVGADHTFPPVIEDDDYDDEYEEELLIVKHPDHTKLDKNLADDIRDHSTEEEESIDPMSIPANDLEKDEDIPESEAEE